MRFYPQQHKHYCGIDLQARSMSVCIRAQAGTVLVPKSVAAPPEAFLGSSARFPRAQDVGSYCRLVKCAKESAGKRPGRSGKKSGTPQLKGAFSAAAVLFVRQPQPG